MDLATSKIVQSLLIALMVTLSVPASASHARELLVAAGASHGYSRDEAVRIAKRRSRGRVLSAKTFAKGGGKMHVIRILTSDGKIRNFRIDARTGEVLKRGDDHPRKFR